jgi:parallel beta-helix repeat protein
MNRSPRAGLFVLVFIFLLTVTSLLVVSKPIGRVLAGNLIIVPDNYPTVGVAVEAASDGDTIFIKAGQYTEGNILINKTLSIVGESVHDTTVDGDGSALFIFQIIASDVTVENLTLRHTANDFFHPGTSIRVFNATNARIRNVLTDEVYHGIELRATSFSTILDCQISNSTANGLYIHDTSTGNAIFGSTISNNSIGIFLASAADQFNLIYHNNFINNTSQIVSFGGVNYYDNGYPSGGNYFSDSVGTDVNYTSGQNVPGSDGVFDTSYLGDNYPFVNPLWRFNVAAEGKDFVVQASTNVTLSSCTLNVSAKTLEFRVQALSNFTGSVRVEIPKAMLNCTTLSQWNVTLWDNGGARSPFYLLPLEDTDHTYLYFTFDDTATVSRIDVEGTAVVPEYGVLGILLLLACLTVVFAFVRNGRRRATRVLAS